MAAPDHQLFTALLNKNVNAMRLAIEDGANVNLIRGDGTSLLWVALAQIHCEECAILLVDAGCRKYKERMRDVPFFIQILSDYILLHNINPVREFLDNFIHHLLNTLTPAELKVRDSTGLTPYMYAVRLPMPEELKEEIRIRTGALATNKNIYGRTSNNYKKIKERERAAGGKRRKTRRNRRNRRSRSRR